MQSPSSPILKKGFLILLYLVIPWYPQGTLNVLTGFRHEVCHTCFIIVSSVNFQFVFTIRCWLVTTVIIHTFCFCLPRKIPRHFRFPPAPSSQGPQSSFLLKVVSYSVMLHVSAQCWSLSPCGQ